MDKLTKSFPDPTVITGTAREAQWAYECKVAAIFKKVTAEILDFVEQQKETAKVLRAKANGETIEKFNIGR